MRQVKQREQAEPAQNQQPQSHNETQDDFGGGVKRAESKRSSIYEQEQQGRAVKAAARKQGQQQRESHLSLGHRVAVSRQQRFMDHI